MRHSYQRFNAVMRVFCAVRHSNDPARYYGGLWSGNFYPALRELGHEIIESKTDLLPTSRFMHVASGFTPEETAERARATERIIDEVKAAHAVAPIDLFLSYFYNSHFDPAGFDELRGLGIPSINFYCNSMYQFDFVAAIAAAVDFSWHPEKEARDSYLKVGARPVWVQMGADPNVYRPILSIARNPSACFVGQRYADRDRWIAALVRAKIPVDIYGGGWKESGEVSRKKGQACVYLGRVHHRAATAASYGEVVKDLIAREGLESGVVRVIRQARYRAESKRLMSLLAPHTRGTVPQIAEIFAAHSICLNFSNVWADGRPWLAFDSTHVRLRDFEAPMCRTCYLTGYTDEIGEFYEFGKEIDTYSTTEELIDKTRFYLRNLKAAESLRAAGYGRARADHTWKRRFPPLFLKI